MASQVNSPSLAPGPVPPGVGTDVPGPGSVPFARAASPPRTAISVQTSGTLTAATQPVLNVIPGTGYMLWLDNLVTVTGATGNTATIALAEDAPWSFLSSIALDAGGPQNVNLTGFAAYLIDIYGGSYFMTDPSLSTDTSIYSALSTGTGTAAGGGTFNLRVPLAINQRSYWGLMGNQDRATKYNYRSDIAPSASVYSTAPTNLPTFTVARAYGYLPVPSAISPDGRRQAQVPDTYGIVHYLTMVRSDALPAASSTINHYIRNLANAVRLMILVFRSNALRSTANSNMPTQIDFLLGTDVIYSESAATRRRIMYGRYGFNAPNGVLVYDFVSDFGLQAGVELGDHYLYLGNISEAQFRITYPSGWNNTSASLDIITDALYIPPNVDIYGAGIAA